MKGWKSALIIVYFAIQLLAPVRGFLYDKIETRGDFSWNMYSKRYGCRIHYVLTDRRGARYEIDHKSFFRRPSRSTKVMHRDTLPVFHRFLCETYEARGELGEIEGTVGCRENLGTRYELVADGDICTAENWGVLPASSREALADARGAGR